jgi:hypothetical protein
VSAGVYDGEGRLVRALFQNQARSAGRHAGRWDGKDEEGKAVGAGSYQVRVLSNQVRYEWEGVIGNTSSERTGEGKHRGMGFLEGMVAVGEHLYAAGGYSEGMGVQLKMRQSNPQARQILLPANGGGLSDQSTYQVCSDGVRVYWGGRDAYSPHWFVFATQVGSDAPVTFSAGQSLKMTHGRTYSATGVVNAANGAITGLAVQASGPYLFIARRARNELQVIDKTTGALVRILSVASPGGLATDGQNRLYVAAGSRVVRYEVNPDGSLGGGQLSITGLESAQALALSPEGGTLAVADGGSSQQVKGYSTTTGALAWTLGQPGGYTQTATVSPDRFDFRPVKGGWSVASLAFQPDGRLWVRDGGNLRYQRFSPERRYETSVQFLPRLYNTAVDPNNPTRVFADRLEFQIDYGRPLAPDNGSWRLVRNYANGLDGPAYEHGDNFFAPTGVATLSNGRTYGLVRNQTRQRQEVLELTSAGARPTGLFLEFTERLQADGSRWAVHENWRGGVMRVTRRALTGFDGSGNPQWGTEQTQAQTTQTTAADPIISGPYLSVGEVTSSGLLVGFHSGLDAQQYHLGVLPTGQGAQSVGWRWRGARSTPTGYTGPFPEDGAFDIGNGVQYGGNRALALERSIFWGYHGEFWKNGQTNKYTHVWDNGLLVGQFGAVREGATAAAGMAGNAFTPQVVKVGGDYYLYHGDESDHGGVHRWKITNLQSIQEQQIPVVYPAAEALSSEAGVDLMAGLPYGQVLTNHTHGWSRQPTAENLTARYSNYWSVRTGVKSHTRPDVSAEFRGNSGEAWVRRDLGEINSSHWKLTGFINLEGHEGNSANNGSYFEVVDGAGRPLARIQMTIDYNDYKARIMLNDQTVLTLPLTAMSAIVSQWLPISIQYADGALTMQYGAFPPVKVNPVNGAASLSAPRALRIYNFAGPGPSYGRSIALHDLRFVNAANTAERAPVPSLTTPATPTWTADDAANTLAAHHALGTGELVVSENGGGYQPYTGTITVGNVARPAGYWKVKVKAASGRNESAVAESPAFTVTAATPPPAVTTPAGGRGTGLQGQYHNNRTLSGAAVLTRLDATVDFNWGNGSPQGGTVSSDNFSVRWTGRLEAPVAGVYRLATVSDDGVRVKVGGQLVIDNWTDHAPTRNETRELSLTAGQQVPIEVEYYEAAGGTEMRLQWTFPGQGWQTVPKERLYPENAPQVVESGNTTPPTTPTVPPGALAPGCYTIKAKHSGKFIQFDGSNDGSQLRQHGTVNAAAQQFRIERLSEGPYTIRNIANQKAWTVRTTAPGTGTAIVQDPFAGGATQRWRIESVGDGSYKLGYAALFADVLGGLSTDNAGLILWSGHGADNQRFLLQSVSCPQESPAPPPAATTPAGGRGTGLQGQYHNNRTLSGAAVLTRLDATVDFNWGNGSPQGGTVSSDNFSVRWTGRLEAPVAGVYRLATVSDDGVRVKVGGQLVIDNWTDHAPTRNETRELSLTAGQQVPIEVEYYEAAGGTEMRLQWTFPGQGWQTVPKERLYPENAPAGCTAPAVPTLSGGGNVCNGQTVTLTASGTGTIRWSNGATGTSITVGAGTYSAYAESGTCRSGSSNAITVTANCPTPTPPSASQSISCSGHTFTNNQVLGTFMGRAVQVRLIGECLYVTIFGNGGKPVNTDWLRGVITENAWAAGVKPFGLDVVRSCFKNETHVCGGAARMRSSEPVMPTDTRDLRLMPNPATEWVEIQLTGGEVLDRADLYDLRGRLLLTTDQYRLRIEALPAGTYLVNVKTQAGTHYRKRLVKQ